MGEAPSLDVDEFLAGSVTQAQLARRYDISPHLVIQLRKSYAVGRLVDYSRDTAQDERIKELERIVGRLTMENELLKKAVQHTFQERNEHSFRQAQGRPLIISGPGAAPSDGGAK